MVVYICGPISLGGQLSTPEEVERNIWAFNNLAQNLRADDIEVLNPVEVPPQPDWKSYMVLTIPMVCAADVIVCLPGWRLSRGARLEVFLALELEKLVCSPGELATYLKGIEIGS